MRRRPRIFTLEDLNALIPELQQTVDHVFSKKQIYDRKHDEVFMHELLTEAERSLQASSDGPVALERDCLSLEEDLLDLEREMGKITRLGCAHIDLDNGCLEFLGRKDGKLVFFCWRPGDAEIRYYRPYHSKSDERLSLA